MTTNLSQLTDDTLLAETARAADTERRATAELLTLLTEVERRSLHLSLGHSSMFAFCTRVLRLSEQAAFRRITAARAARRFPAILTRLADGALSLTSVGLLAPHLTDETVEMMPEAASHKSTRDVERFIAAWDPQPAVPTVLRALPTTTSKAGASSAMLVFADSAASSGEIQRGPEEAPVVQRPRQSSPPPRATLAPIAPQRYLLKLTISQDTQDKLQRGRHFKPRTKASSIGSATSESASRGKPVRIGSASVRGRGRSARTPVLRRRGWRTSSRRTCATGIESSDRA